MASPLLRLAGGFAALCLLAPPATAQVQLPAVHLPAPSSEPSLWLRPADLAAIRARKQDPAYAPLYQSVKAYVDARAGQSMPALDDDTLSKVAKGAAALHQLGDALPGGGSYRDLAVSALRAVRGRTPPPLIGSGGTLNAQYDCGRLQSIAEARDLLRGTGVSSSDLAAIDARIGEWADAFEAEPFLPFRVNNLSAKAGAALVTCALAMAHDARATGWLSHGYALLTDAVTRMTTSDGWWLEGPHYLSYTLNNLLPAAYHVRSAAGVDWFPALRPLVEASLALRLPSGEAAPFEDAVPLTFPWRAMAGGYAGSPLAASMLWAWERSPKDTSNFEVQQLHAASVLLAPDPAVGAAAPTGPATRFLAGEAHAHVLATGREADALQIALLTARDYSDLALLTSRHNIQSPLDLALSAGGEDLLVTGTGGPEITQSQSRSTYLLPSSRSTVLVGGTAPFTADPARITSDARIDGGLLDAGRTAVAGYAGADRVRRTVALVAGRYGLVLDEVEASAPVSIDTVWRGRAGRQLGAIGAGAVACRWTKGSASLDLISIGSAALSASGTSGLYAPRYGVEETIEPFVISMSASRARLLTLLDPHAAGAPSVVAGRLGVTAGAGLALEVTLPGGGVHEVLSADGWVAGASGAGTDAALAVVSSDAGRVVEAALVDGTRLEAFGGPLLTASSRVTLTYEPTGNEANVIISRDAGEVTITLHGLASTGPYHAMVDGAPLQTGRVVVQGADVRVERVPAGGGTLEVLRGAPPIAAAGSGGSSGGGGGGGCEAAPGGETPDASLLFVLLALVVGRARTKR